MLKCPKNDHLQADMCSCDEVSPPYESPGVTVENIPTREIIPQYNFAYDF